MEPEKHLSGIDQNRIEESGAPDYEDFFPRSIDFFGIGRVSACTRRCQLAECATAKLIVTFQVMGDELGLCAVAFDTSPATDDELSMFVELANIVSSKFITQLADANCTDIMISPPSALPLGDPKRRYVEAALRSGGTHGSIVRQYEYSGESRFTLRLAYLPSHKGGSS